MRLRACRRRPHASCGSCAADLRVHRRTRGSSWGRTGLPRSRPNEPDLADFTYVPLDGGGFGYTAFVERAICQDTAYRARQGHRFTGETFHHSDAGSHYTATYFTGTLLLAGLVPSIGIVGEALDSALAETTIEL